MSAAMSDNAAAQTEEIEALSSIYGTEFRTEDAENRVYSIDVESGPVAIEISVTLPAEYPSAAPPVYVLRAPWLRGRLREELGAALEEVYLQNAGDSIVHLWVERARDFLQENLRRIQEPGEEDAGTQATADIPSEDSNHNKPAMTCPEIYHGEKLTDRKSVFQPHLAFVTHRDQVALVMRTLRQNRKIDAATHNIYAYRIFEPFQRRLLQGGTEPGLRELNGCEDDGEIHAGGRLLHLLTLVDARDVIVIVTRWYGGIHLGPDRFKHINGCAREILDEHGCIKHKESPKRGKKHK